MTEKENKIVDFLSYIKTPLSKNSISVLYSANNIRHVKCQLFSDYTQSLLILVFDTYMGDDLTNEEERIDHFNWCWKKNNENFKDENIVFHDNDEAYDYFLEFMTDAFYLVRDKDSRPRMRKTILNIWLSLFTYNKTKTRSDVDNFLEIYGILDKSLKKG